MKKNILLLLLIAAMCFSLVACINTDCACKCDPKEDSDSVVTNDQLPQEQLPKGHATEIQYERPYTGQYTNNIQYIRNADFEYVNNNIVKITLDDGSIMYIDSARIVFIKVATEE